MADVAREQRNLNDYLKGKPLEYSDDFYSLKGQKRYSTDFCSFNEYEALNGVRDNKTNNYSNLFLTSRRRNAEIIEYKDLDKEGQPYSSSRFTTISTKGLYLYWQDVYTETGITPSLIEPSLKHYDGEYNERYQFDVTYIDNGICQVKKEYRGEVYYLSVKDTSEWDLYVPEWKEAQKGTQESWSKQDYHELLMWSTQQGGNNKWTTRVVDEGIVFCIEIPREDGNEVKYIRATDSLGIELADEGSVFIVPQKEFDHIELPLNESWVNYDNNIILGGINENKSKVDLCNQFIIHHEYNTDSQVNWIPLKNNITYQGNTIQGAFNSPDSLSWRQYNTITSGFEQEKGNDSIILSYTFRDQEYAVKPGGSITIKIPSKEENGGTSPLQNGDRETLPLNETSFIRNGAFGSDVPFFADQFKRLTVVTEHDAVNNGVYLTSWLKRQSLDNEKMVWMDRYYYPDIASRKEALEGKSAYSLSFENYPDREDSEDLRNALRDKGFYDMESNVQLEAGNEYQYNRISSTIVDEVMDSIGQNVMNAVYDQNDKKVNLYQAFKFNHDNFRKIDCSGIDEIHGMNFNADMLIDPKKPIGIQLLGASHDRGLMIKNRQDLAPYHYYATEDCVMMLNNAHEIVHSLSLKELYDERVLKVLMGDMFENVVVVCPMNMYVLSYDLQVKMRVSLSSDDNSVYGISDNHKENVLNKAGFDLQGYPYINSSIVLDNFNGNEGTLAYRGTSTMEVGKLTSDFVKQFTINAQDNNLCFKSNVASLIVDTGSILYRNNIYVPCGEHIIKFIFTNDSARDFELNKDNEYPVYARILEPALEEVYYNLSSDDFVVVREEHLRRLHSVYVDDEGRVFGFNFDRIAMSADRNTVYGTFAEENYSSFNSGGKFYHQIFTQSLSRLKLQADGGNWKYSPRVEYIGLHSFDFVTTAENGCLSFVTNYSTKEYGDHTYWNIYDKSKQLAYRMEMDVYDKILSLDAYNYINADNEERHVFMMLAVIYHTVYMIEWDSITGQVTRTAASQLSDTPIETFNNTNNPQSLLRHTSSNALYFQLHTLSNSIFYNRMEIVWDISKVSRGWYNINVSADLDKATFEVRINDKLHGRIYSNTDGQAVEVDSDGKSTIRPDYAFFKPLTDLGTDLFNHTYYFGTIGKEYGSHLNETLRNDKLHDPYACGHGECENALFIAKSLSLHEYQAMRLYGKNINPIVLTLPCGIRNGIDEMVRYFKYSGGGAVSNKVRVNIHAHGLDNPADIENVKSAILDEIERKGDALTDIHDIKFTER